MPAAGATHKLVAALVLQVQAIAHCFPAPPDLQGDPQLVSTQGEQQQLLAAAQRQLQGERAATVAAATARRLAGAEGSSPAAGWVLAILKADSDLCTLLTRGLTETALGGAGTLV